MEKITMVKIYNSNSVMDPNRQDLFCRRARARWNLDLELEYLSSHLTTGLGNVKDVLLKPKSPWQTWISTYESLEHFYHI